MKATSKLKTPSTKREDDMSRYDWDNATRGRYASLFPRDTHAVVIDPQVWPHFGSADRVNEALRTLLMLSEIIRSSDSTLPSSTPRVKKAGPRKTKKKE